ncbi:hypothetical protein D3C81_1986640 [compost metagenome]
MRWPSSMTVQAPHWPWSQPFLVPVSCRCSRKASSKVVRVSSSRLWRRPLTSRLTFIRTGGAWPAVLTACAAPATPGTAAAVADSAPAISKPRLPALI